MISTIRLLYPESFSPFTYTANGRAGGLVIDRLTRVLGSVDIRPEFIPCGHEELIDGLKEGRGDVAACLAVTDERRDFLVFSRTILQTGAALFGLNGTKTFISPEELPGRKVATPSSGPLVELLRNTWPEVRVVETADYSEALRAVAAGSADMAALNLHAGWEAAESTYPGRFRQPADVFVSLALASAGLYGYSEHYIDTINTGIDSIEST